jgi:hypothetical protein
MRSRRNPNRVLVAAAAAAALTLGLAATASAEHDYRTDRRQLPYDYDLNRDGVVDRSEAEIKKFDMNRDGRLDATERRRLLENRRTHAYGDYGTGYADRDYRRGHTDRDYRRGHADHARTGQAARAMRRADQVMAYFDRNRDGYLTWTEVERTDFADHFDAADYDRNGYLTEAEVEHYLGGGYRYHDGYRYNDGPDYRHDDRYRSYPYDTGYQYHDGYRY